MRLAEILILSFFILTPPATAWPPSYQPSQIDPRKNNPNPDGLKRCRCDGFDGGPNKAQCYLTRWSTSILPWDGTTDHWICATYNEPYTQPDMDQWFECRSLRYQKDPDPKGCEDCAQAGQDGDGSPNQCRGSPACYAQSPTKDTDADFWKNAPQRCDDRSVCPMISDQDQSCSRQWWPCGQPPSKAPPCGQPPSEAPPCGQPPSEAPPCTPCLKDGKLVFGSEPC